MKATGVPPFHVSGLSKAKGNGDVFISSRRRASSSGIFHIDMNVHFDPAVDNDPAGTLRFQTDMSDGDKGVFTASTIEFLNSYDKHDPTIYLTGQCKPDSDTLASLDGCRYWLMVVNNTKNNHRTPDIVGFCIHDCNGNRIAYGSGL